MTNEQMIQILKEEITPALGCTEPVAIAYAAARARAVLGSMPGRARINVSRNILKNAMGVGIPGTDMVGLEMAAALGIIGGDSDAILEVLASVTKEHICQAKEYARECVQVSLKDTPRKLYIEVILEAEEDHAIVVIEDSHTNITRIVHGNTVIYEQSSCEDLAKKELDKSGMNVDRIYRFVCSVDIEELKFFDRAIDMNWAVAQEGLKAEYGLRVGRSILDNSRGKSPADDIPSYAAAMAAAAADARMSGSTLPVMTICGSGNQGITAILPIVAAVRAKGGGEEMLYRCLALSCLITIHVKRYIGKLSALCGCGMGSSIGVCCGLVYMWGGGLNQIKSAIRNMTADVSGIICDGAKAGCALKIGTVISSAFQCAMVAMKNYSAGDLDGIVSDDVESTIRNLGELGNRGMADTDKVILDMMVCR